MDATIQMNTMNSIMRYSILSDYVVDIIIAFCLLTAGAEQAPPWPQNNNKKKKKNQKMIPVFQFFFATDRSLHGITL